VCSVGESVVSFDGKKWIGTGSSRKKNSAIVKFPRFPRLYCTVEVDISIVLYSTVPVEISIGP
jgi:hypothetical protein